MPMVTGPVSPTIRLMRPIEMGPLSPHPFPEVKMEM